MDRQKGRLRELPKIDDLLRRADVKGIPAPRWAVVAALRDEVGRLRRDILGGTGEATVPDLAEVARRSSELASCSLRRVVNGTGVVLHTNLGRAPLAEAAVRAALDVARSYSNLEYDLSLGERGSRHDHLSALLTDITGAEDAVVVNNNAAAVLLALSARARDREVVISRGELIEIGGSFRIPEVMAQGGARLVEVGTTNKTRLDDYQRAVTSETALLLKVHRSNFAMVGFCEEVSANELAALGKQVGVGTMIDLGSGTLLPIAEQSAHALPVEPDVASQVASGADLVTFSGDKLLGGPQAGIVVGTRSAVADLARHPLMRALRPDKLTLAALWATLRLYRDGHQEEVPIVAMLTASEQTLRARAQVLAARISGEAGGADGRGGEGATGVAARVIECSSAAGGGALPGARLRSFGVALEHRGVSASAIERLMRGRAVPIIGRVIDGSFVVDCRTLLEGDTDEIVAAAQHLSSEGAP